MTEPLVHRWDLGPREARALQALLAPRVEREDRLPPVVRFVAGVDVGFDASGRRLRAAVAVLNFPELCLVDAAVVVEPVRFPYVPGLLSFREVPPVLAAMARLSILPDLVLADGQGIAHPRRFGFASHLGLCLDRPTIGVAKSRLIGTHGEPGPNKGDWIPLYDGEEIIGAVVRTRRAVAPVYVSIGHRVSLASAIHYTLACTSRFRLPETTRAAHRLASEQGWDEA